MGRLREGRVLGERYELVRQVGRGGMGVVWEACDQRLDRAVAVKILALAGDQETEKHRVRFEQEARLLAGLSSPHLAHVYDYGFDEAKPYLVQEFLSGEDLAQRLKKAGSLVPEEADRLLTHFAKGLGVAHDAGIVHRDLKPANIFLATVAGEEEVVLKLLDFGVAKSEGGDFTATGDFLGSLPYMSPEQTRGAKHVDKRSDIWSAGVILFQMLTGKRPFDGDAPTTIVRKVREGAIPKPSAVCPELGARYDQFFKRALSRDPEHRFSSMSEMSRAFSDARQVHAKKSESSTKRAARAPSPVAPKPPQSLKARLRHGAPRFAIAMVLGSLLGIGARVVASAGTDPPPMPTIEVNPDVSPEATAVVVDGEAPEGATP